MTITPYKNEYYAKQGEIGAIGSTRQEAIKKCISTIKMNAKTLIRLKKLYLHIENQIEEKRIDSKTYNESMTELNYQLNTVFHEMMLVGSFTHADAVSFINSNI